MAAIELKNNAVGFLSTAISASDVGIALQAGDGAEFPALTGDEFFYATISSTLGTYEIVKVTARSVDSLTIVRAQEGTSAASFAAGARIEMRVTAQSILDAITLRSMVSVKDFGAVGDGVADDTAAIQAAIDSVATPRGGTVFFPKGLYYITSTLTLASESTMLLGAGTGVNHNSGGSTTQDGATQIIGGHTSGPVIRIKKRGCRVQDLVISSDTARRAATSGSNVYGIWVEADDSITENSNGPWRIFIEHVHVLKQPSHGIVMIGNIIASGIYNTDVDNCNGHGIVFDDGTLTGRVNLARPGQTNLFNIRVSRVDGSALRIGSMTSLENMPYRINCNNVECFLTMNDPATYNADGKQGAISGFMENCDFINCATGGTSVSGITRCNGFYISGILNVIRNHRFINNEPYCAYIDDFGITYRTTDIRFETLYIANSSRSTGYYNPAIYVSNPDIRNIYASSNIYFGIVSSLLDTTASQYAEVSYKDSKIFNGSMRSSFRSWPAFSLADNQAGYFTIDTSIGRQGVLVISGNVSAAGSGMAAYRVGDASSFCTTISGIANFATTTGTLSGTTGVDGNLTISVDTTQARIYVENRTGSSRSYIITNLSTAAVVQNFALV